MSARSFSFFLVIHVYDLIARAKRVPERVDVTPERFEREIASAYQPVVLRAVASDWPAVAAAREGRQAMARYVRRFDGGKPIKIFAAPPQSRGCFSYSDDHRGFNFRTAHVLLPALLEALTSQAGDLNAPSLYAGSGATPDMYPGWAEENVLSLPTPGAVPRLWLGNASRVSAHYDTSDNIAVVVSGSRRFALFPPEQAANLYVGPIDNTIAGQPTSLIDIENPDLDTFPRFADAASQMQIAELKPGDAIYIPALWWHDVKATGPFNVLVNYWWGQGEGGSAFAAMVHAIMAIRDLPSGQRQALKSWFDLYVFDDEAPCVADHLPRHARGVLGPASAQRDTMIRGYLRRILDAESG